MIEVYARERTDYGKNGDMTLFPESCTVTAELNGAWYMEITHPLDNEDRWKYITEEAVIAAPTFMGRKQLFRVDDVEKTDTEVTAKAYPVFFDSSDDCFLMDVRPTGKNGQQALYEMTAGSRYSGQSDITGGSTAYFVRRNLMDAINGEESPTFIERWGGEILYDNYTVIINRQVGADRGVEVRYGKNMTAIRHHIDMSGIVTRIVPVAYNGYMMSSGNYVDSENIGKYAKVYTKEIKFENIRMAEDAGDEEEPDVIVCESQAELDAALKNACEQQYASGADLPAITLEIDLVELSNTEEYKDVGDLETIGLGDIVHCYNQNLDISTDARVIKIIWDCIYDEIQTVTLGSYEKNYFSDMTSSAEKIENVVSDDGCLMAERVKGILDGMQTQLRLQNTVAKKQEARAILFEDLDPESELYGALAIGTQGWEISKKRTADGKDWVWTTAATAGGIVADAIITGLLSDRKGKNFWDLDTGEFSLSSTADIGGETLDKNIKDALNAQTQTDIFNKLTDNGKLKGIFMKDGELYINASYLLTGILTDGVGKNYWNLETGEFSLSSEAKIGGKTIEKNIEDGIDAQTQTDIFNKLTDNGKLKGIFMKDGELYINASYLLTGILTDGVGKNYWNLETGEFRLTSADIGITATTSDEYPIMITRTVSNDRTDKVLIGASGFLLTSDIVDDLSKYLKLSFRADSIDLDGGTFYGTSPGVPSAGSEVEDGDPAYLKGKYQKMRLSSDGQLKADWIYGNTRTDAGNVYISSNGFLYRSSSSSRRYKTDESTNLGDIHPEALYKLPIKVFRYKPGYLIKGDPWEGKLVLGFIVEDLLEIFPQAVEYEDGQPEMWNDKVIIPAMLKLVQEQHEEIEDLKGRVAKLEKIVKEILKGELL